MTVLLPMRQEAFDSFLNASAAAYAEDNIRSGRWPTAGAIDRARADLIDSLPQGLNTADNYLFEITSAKANMPIGYVWFAVQKQNGQRCAFVYDIEIKPEFRRQGHATAAFAAIEERAAELGLQSIGLHVFAFNKSAQALYKKLGYAVTGINMQKKLAFSAQKTGS